MNDERHENTKAQTSQLTRRDVVKSALVGVGGTMMGRLQPVAATEQERSGYTDAHSHIWTRDVARFPLREGTKVDDLDPPSFTAEELLEVAKPEGVRRVVLIAHHLYYGFDNRYMTDAAKRYPGTFKVVGMVDDAAPNPGASMRRLLKQHVTGFRIVPWIRGENWLDNPGMHEMWRVAAETGQAICCLINPENLPEVASMCRKYPDTPVVIDHFARIGVSGTIQDSDLENLTRLSKFRQTFVKISAYYALGKKQPPYLDLIPMIRRLYDSFGPKRLMWASDAPYQVVNGNTYAASIALVRDRLDFISDGDRRWMLSKTAEKVYFEA